MHTRLAAILGCCLAFLLCSAAGAQPQDVAPAPAADAVPTPPARAMEPAGEDDRWIRLRRTRARELRLQVAHREYAPPEGEAGPRISLVSAVHIADRAYYDELQKMLDAHDLVLFEGVGPPGLGQSKLRKDSARAVRSKHRLTIVGELLESAKNDAGRYPESIEALAKAIVDKPTPSAWLKTARLDGWGNALGYTCGADGQSYELRSFGSDGEPGGDGYKEDIEVDRSEIGSRRAQGIQKRMADTLGLTFQSEGISTDGLTWRNSDMGADELARRLGGDPNAEPGDDADSTTILAMFDPESGMAQMASIMLGFIEMIPGGPARGKLMMMLMLPNAEQALDGLGQMGDFMDMKQTMSVIIQDRNAVVIDDLKQLVEAARRDPAVRPNRVAVFYGGGHMPDLEARLFRDLGYRRVGETWSNAIRMDLTKEGVSDDEIRTLGLMIKQQMDMLQPGKK